MTFSAKTHNSAVLEPRTLELRWDVGLDQKMTLMAKVKVTVTSSTKQAYNSAMLGARTLKRRNVFFLTRR